MARCWADYRLTCGPLTTQGRYAAANLATMANLPANAAAVLQLHYAALSALAAGSSVVAALALRHVCQLALPRHLIP